MEIRCCWRRLRAKIVRPLLLLGRQGRPMQDSKATLDFVAQTGGGGSSDHTTSTQLSVFRVGRLFKNLSHFRIVSAGTAHGGIVHGSGNVGTGRFLFQRQYTTNVPFVFILVNQSGNIVQVIVQGFQLIQ